MRRLIIVVALIAFIAFVIAAIAIGSMVRSGLSTHEEPTRIEATLARMVRHWAVPSELRDAKNPMPLTAAALADGRAHFADHCAGCHGNDGKGDSGMGKQMYPRTPDMTLDATQSLSDGRLFAIIENGVRLTGMPGFGNGTAESAAGSWALVHFIRHLPKLTAEEIAEMEKLNPKSPAEFEAMKAEEEFLRGGGSSTENHETAPAHHH
ncbi:MAG: c-type cytochrome [Thermoanaerobaculia bacterium]